MNKPYIVEDGYPFIIVPLLLAVAAGYFINAYAVVPLLLLAAYFTYFFRNPSRTMPTDDHLLVSPADGTVVGVEEVEEDAYLNQKCRKIIIFLSIFDAHVNRAPLPGTIDFQQYTCGRFRPAYKEVTIIAGILARRIVSWVTLGDELQHGQLYGMIKFGSCAEIYVRDNVEITVKKGQKVRAGESVIGRIV